MTLVGAPAEVMTEATVHRPLILRLATAAIVLLTIAASFGALAFVRWSELTWGERIWLTAVLTLIAIRLPYAFDSSQNPVVATSNDRMDQMLLAGMGVTGVALPLTHLATSLLGLADFEAPSWITAVGAAMSVAAVWLFLRSHVDLGRHWSASLEFRADHKLVTKGSYRFVRHPMYAAAWIWSLAQPMLLHNWLAGGLIVPAFAALYFIRVPCEEAMLRERFGMAYDEYAARTGRLLPKCWSF